MTRERRDAPSAVRAALGLLRPLHWVKNLVVLAPLVFAGRLTDAPSLVLALQTAAAFCLLASAGYVGNDLHDAPFDRLHPVRSRRPLARRALGPGAALFLLLACAAGAAFLGLRVHAAAPPLEPSGLASLGVPHWLAAYALLAGAYTLLLKRIAGADLAALSACFVLRACAGAAALQLAPSGWLLLCAALLALFLGAGKRRLELQQLGELARRTRPMLVVWRLPVLDRLIDALGTGTAFAFALYALSQEPGAGGDLRELLLTVPLVAWLLWRHRQRLRSVPPPGLRPLPGPFPPPPRGDDAVEILLRDRPSVAGFLIWSAAVLHIVYRPW